MLYIITAVHNRYKITESFIEKINKQTYKEVKLILVDDGSTDGTSDMVKEKMPDAIIIRGNGNLWWGGALHEAYKYLIKNDPYDCEYVMFINDDTSISDDFLERGVEHLCKNPNSLITGCGYSVNDGRLIDGAVNYDVKTGRVTRLEAGNEGNCASTRALIMEFDSFKKIGGFHPIVLPHYASDYEYTIRASKKGLRILSFKDFSYSFDEETTGYNNIKSLSLKKLFSKRSRFNPVYRMAFVFMVTPLRYIPNNIIHGIKRAKTELK